MNQGDLRPILYVEDSDEDYASLCFALQACGVANPVERCADGRLARAALSTAAGCARARAAAIILLDLNLPGVSGHELLTLFRQRGATAPVIVFSTSSHASDVSYCYRAGANAYLVKPLEFDRWQEMLGAMAHHWLKDVVHPQHEGTH